MVMDIRESQIEDVMATYPQITQRLLGINEQLSLLARQMILPSGRLDLLFAAGDRILLLELKVEECSSEFVGQLEVYRQDLVTLQERRMLVQGTIEAFLVCPAFSYDAIQRCKEGAVIPLIMDPIIRTAKRAELR